MKKILDLYIKVNLILLPIFFLPFVQSSFGFGKNFFLFITALIGLVIWLVSLFLDKDNVIVTGRNIALFFVFLLLSIFSWTRLSPSGKSTSLSDPNGLTSMISLFLWYFLWLQNSTQSSWNSKLNFLNISAIILTVTSIAIFLVPDTSIPLSIPSQNPLVVITKTWSLTGSVITEASFLLFILVENIRQIIKSSKKASQDNQLLRIIQSGIVFIGFCLAVYKLITFGWVHLDYKTAWLIAADSFKNVPILGVGLGNFINAFNLFRPNFYNLGPNWNQRFVISSSGLLHYWTELGLSFMVLFLVFVSKFLRQYKKAFYVPALVLVLIFTFLPPNLTIMWLLALYFSNHFLSIKQIKAKFVVGEQLLNIAPLLTAFIVVIIVIFGGYISTKKVIARTQLRRSLVAASQNDGSTTYNLQIKAIAADPNWAELRRLYSQTNIGLAQSLSQQKDVSDQDKEKISLLIQQAVREAKAAINLDSTSTIYWQNLANIYKGLIGSVEGASDYALQSYQQAAILDPADPLVRMDLASLYFAANQFESADRFFEEAVVRKNNYANAWYNWAHTAKKLNRLSDAVSRLSQSVALVPADSGDWEKANQELLDWKVELDKAVKKQQELISQQQQKPAETLTQPEPLPTSGQEEIVNIPATDLEPPQVKDNITPEPDKNNTDQTNQNQDIPTPGDATQQP